VEVCALVERHEDKAWRESDEFQWCVYHASVAARRDGDLDLARQLFSELVHIRRFNLGATHQLAVIHIVEARRARDPKLRMEHLASALKLLRRCLKKWKRADGHRPGFTHRRIADVHCLMAEIGQQEQNLSRAHHHLAEALELFSARKLKRYVDATKDSLQLVFDLKGKQLATIPPVVTDPPRRHGRIHSPRAHAPDGGAAERQTRQTRRTGRARRKAPGREGATGAGGS
jgi:hypothetical protein